MIPSTHLAVDEHDAHSVLSCVDLGFAYTTSGWSLDGINIELERGGVLALTGPNGSGKTTLIRLLATVRRPAKGSIRLFGFDPLRRSGEVRRRIAYVAQRGALADGLSTYDNLLLAASFHGLSPRRARERVAELSEIFALEGLHKQTVGQLSGGQYRRVTIARAMVGDPELVLLDEPTVGMDAASRSGFHRFLKALASEAGVTIVIASHDSMEVACLADKCLALDNGRVQCVEMNMESTAFVERYLVVNFLRKVPPEANDHFSRLVASVRILDDHTIEFGVTSGEPLNELLKIIGAAAPVVSIGVREVQRAAIQSA